MSNMHRSSTHSSQYTMPQVYGSKRDVNSTLSFSVADTIAQSR